MTANTRIVTAEISVVQYDNMRSKACPMRNQRQSQNNIQQNKAETVKLFRF